MSKNQYLIPNISNNPYKLNQKSNMHGFSPNIKPIQSQSKKIQNNLFPKNNNYNFSIKVNKIRLKQEKIIEGELNFEDNNKKRYYLLNNQKQRSGLNNTNNNNKQQKRRLPNKSPIQMRGLYKPNNDIFSFNNLFNTKNKYLNYEQKYNQNLINNYMFLNNNNNIHFSKTFSSAFKKGDRSHTPILRTNNRQLMNLDNNKNGNKKRRETKSPILGKSSNFKRNENFGIALSNFNNKEKRYKYVNNYNINNINNINNKALKGDIHKDPFFNNRNNNFNNLKLKKGVNIVNINVRPISHNNIINNNYNKNNINLYDEEINMNLLKLNSEKNKESINNIKKDNNINNNTRKIARPKSPKNSLRNNKNHIIINDNNIEKEKIIKEIKEENKNKEIEINNEEKEKEKNKININISNNIIDTKKIKPEEQKQKKIIRSHSQTPLDPLNKKPIEDSPFIKPKEEEVIAPLPKKVLKKIRDIYEFTHVGFDGEEPKENNQDNFFIYKNFAENKDYIYMSVCDGHGVEGHFVSDFIKDVLPFYMSENLKNTNILKEKELSHQIIIETFILVNSMLVSNENINSLFSGSTCVSVIFTPEKLIVPNIGDSRAVLGRYDKTTNSYKAIELSRDHKPTEKDEVKRIIENEGRIQPFTEEGEFVGPQRVWLKDEEVPGLAMTRSFGDRVAATVGVISEPEIKEFDFDENDKFMIIASDGIWEFISSQECVEIIKEFYEKNDMKGCAEFLYEESSKRWLKEEEVIDDTTLILVFFD